MKNKLSYEQTMMNTWQSEKNSHNKIYIYQHLSAFQIRSINSILDVKV